MLAFLQSLVNVLLFRAGPQDVPSSWYLLKISAGASLLTAAATAVGMLNLGITQALITSVAKILVYALLVYLLLKSSKKPERWLQTMITLYGTLAITNAISIPFVPDLQEVEEGKYVIVPGYGVMIVAALEIWFLVILARTLRAAPRDPDQPRHPAHHHDPDGRNRGPVFPERRSRHSFGGGDRRYRDA